LKRFLIVLLFLVFTAGISYSSENDLFKNLKNEDAELFIEIGSDRQEESLFEGEEIVFCIAADRDCNIMLLRLTTEGKLVVLFPNKSHPDYEVTGGVKYQIPGFNMEKIKVEGPAGTEIIKAIASIDNSAFENLSGLSDHEGYRIPENQEIFLQELSSNLSSISKGKWITSEIEIAVEENLDVNITNNTVETNSVVDYYIDKDFTTENYMQGCSYYSQGKYDDAINSFKKVLEENPYLGYGYYSLGLCYHAKGAFNEAISYYKLCIDHKVKERDCYIRVGEIYDEGGDKKEAYFRYKKALRITEGYEDINKIDPQDTTNRKIYELECECEKNPHDKKIRMELAVIYEKIGDFSSGNYHIKKLLEEEIPLYKPYGLEEDKPEVEEPVEIAEPVCEPYDYYWEIEVYTYYEPYPVTYEPPQPPPILDSPIDFSL